MYGFKHLTLGIRSALVVLMLLLVTAPMMVSAQNGTPEIADDQRMLVVSGTGIVDLDPDTADVMFGILTQNESLETAQDESSTRIQNIMDVFTAANVSKEDIQTSYYDVSVINEYDRDGNLIGVQGYEVRTALTVTIRDLSIVGSVLDEAVGAGANEVGSIYFYVENTDEAASQARVKAIENARAKADEMAGAAGVIVTGVYYIEEVSAPQPDSMDYDVAPAAADESAESAPREVPVSPGQTSITVNVQVVFEIEQPRG